MTFVTGLLRKTCNTRLFCSLQKQKASYTLVAPGQERVTFFSLLTADALNATRKTLPLLPRGQTPSGIQALKKSNLQKQWFSGTSGSLIGKMVRAWDPLIPKPGDSCSGPHGPEEMAVPQERMPRRAGCICRQGEAAAAELLRSAAKTRRANARHKCALLRHCHLRTDLEIGYSSSSI
jgi:hypothetical protein